MNRFRPRTVRRAWGATLLVAAVVAAGSSPAIAAAAEDLGTVVVVQSTVPEGGQDFHYTSELPEYSVFSLDDDDDATLPNQLTIENVPAGPYTLLQDEPPVGWILLGVTCNDPDGGTNGYTNGALLDVDAGETITCSFTNSPPTGDVVIRQDTVPNAPVSFHFNGHWGEFNLADDGNEVDDGTWNTITTQGIPPGTYQVSQDQHADWPLTSIYCIDPDGGTTFDLATGTLTLDVDAGEVIECTFTNEPSESSPPPPPPGGTFHIQLDTVPDDAPDVTFTGELLAFLLDDDGQGGSALPNVKDFVDMDLGPWSFTAAVPDAWRLTSVTCADPDNGSSTDLAKGQVIIDLDADEDVTCTFTIEPKPVSPPPAQSCNGKTATIVAAAGVVAVRGTQGPDVIVALAGNVRIDGRGGNDTICAASGDNIINGGAGDDWIDAGDGTNTVDGGAGNDTITAGSGNDTLLGGTGDDDVVAGDGNNLVSTGSGDDTIVTGSGDDRIDGGKNFDTCQPGGGSNSVNNCEA